MEPEVQRLRTRVAILLVTTWALVAFFSWLYIRYLLQLEAETCSRFGIAVLVGALLLAAVSLVLVWSLTGPLLELASPQEQRSPASRERALRSIGFLRQRLYQLVAAGAFLLPFLTGLLFVGRWWEFLAAATTLALISGSLVESLVGHWLGKLPEKLLREVVPAAIIGQGAFRLKCGLLSLLLTVAPALLVGTLASMTCRRVAGTEAAEALPGTFLPLVAVAALVGLAVGLLLAGRLQASVLRWSGYLGGIARGQFNRPPPDFLTDEMVMLGNSISSMVEVLQATVSRVKELTSGMAVTCNQLMLKTAAFTTGAELQSQSVKQTSSALEDLNANIQQASDNLQALARSLKETSEAVKKIEESFGLMSVQTTELQQSLERAEEITRGMGTSVTEVSADIQQLTAAAERTATSVVEMDRSISEVSHGAADTALLARKTIEVAQQGAVAVRRTMEGMDRIVQSTREATNVILGLGNRIEAIGSIVGVIDEIADQTNLLALNAAIIAAQAGEHGRGFAVVADEIRSLAERTASSTREIGQMISDIQNTSEAAIKAMRDGGSMVNQGVELARQAGASLTEILATFQKAVENIEAIAVNTEGQAKSSESVSAEIARVADMAGRISRAVAKLEKAGVELLTQTEKTLETVNLLAKTIGQQAQESRQATAAVRDINEATVKVNNALLEQSKASDGILQAVEQIREIAKNHAHASQDMGVATQRLVDDSGKLKGELDAFRL